LKKYCTDAGQFLDDLLELGAAATIDRLVPDQLQKYFPDLIAIELPSWFDRTRWTTRARQATARRRTDLLLANFVGIFVGTR
jgi:hypothetical protein